MAREGGGREWVRREGGERERERGGGGGEEEMEGGWEKVGEGREGRRGRVQGGVKGEGR